MTGLTDADRVDALLRLADLRLGRWRYRTKVEWRFTLALWSFPIGGATFLKLHGIALSAWAFAFVAIALLGVWIIHVAWVRAIWLSNEMDIRTAFHFAEHAEKVAIHTSTVIPEQRWNPHDLKSRLKLSDFFGSGMAVAEISITALLITGLLIILVLPSK